MCRAAGWAPCPIRETEQAPWLPGVSARLPSGAGYELCSAAGQGWEFISLPRQGDRKDSKASIARCLLFAEQNQAMLPTEL